MSEPFLHNYLFSARMRAFSTTRQGGVSKGRYASFNINPYCGDNAADVSANKALLARALGISTECIVLPHQTHGTASAVITPQFFTLSPQARQQQLEAQDQGKAVKTEQANLYALMRIQPFSAFPQENALATV